jgi:uncharacterized protein (TIGR02266 family)
MVEERRSARRARMSGVHVTYEDAAGDRTKALGLDIGRGGLFIRTATPLTLGKRIALEVQVLGEPELEEPWTALGRVVWARDADDGAERPAGMGVRLIDADDSVLDAIDKLVQKRERTEPGLGEPAVPTSPPPAVATSRGAAPAREETLLGVGGAAPPAPPSPEVSIPIDLVPSRAPVAVHPPKEAIVDTKRRPGRARLVTLLGFIAVAAVAAYVFFDGRVREPAAARPGSAASAKPSASPLPASPASPPATIPDTHEGTGAAPLPPPGAAASASVKSALPSPSPPPATLVPAPRIPRPQPKRTDNPY